MGDLHSNMVPAKEEGNTSTVGMNPRTLPCYFRRCKKGISTNIDFRSCKSKKVNSAKIDFRRCKSKNVNSANIESLPDELLLEILLLVSADDIYHRARFVCRKWYHIIHGDAFVNTHLHHTSYGLLLVEFTRRMTRGRVPNSVAATQDGGIEISKLSCKFRFPIYASCNGLVLGREIDVSEKDAFYIVNPATKRRINLPQFSDGATVLRMFSIAYAAASMKYKVVATFLDDANSFVVQCVILTAGVDSTWRHVAIEQLSPRANRILFRTPLITEGFVHWVSDGNDVLSLNVETEIITETHVPLLPPDYQKKRRKYYYLSTGRCLSLLISCGDLLWEIWEMKPETGEWRKLPCNINWEAHKCRIPWLSLEDEDDSSIRPVGWVKYPELLAFFYNGMDRSCTIYNLHTNEIDNIVLPAHASRYLVKYDVVVHKNTLVWLS